MSGDKSDSDVEIVTEALPPSKDKNAKRLDNKAVRLMAKMTAQDHPDWTFADLRDPQKGKAGEKGSSTCLISYCMIWRNLSSWRLYCPDWGSKREESHLWGSHYMGMHPPLFLRIVFYFPPKDRNQVCPKPLRSHQQGRWPSCEMGWGEAHTREEKPFRKEEKKSWNEVSAKAYQDGSRLDIDSGSAARACPGPFWTDSPCHHCLPRRQFIFGIGRSSTWSTSTKCATKNRKLRGISFAPSICWTLVSFYSRAKLCDKVDRKIGSGDDEAGTCSPAFLQIVSALNAPTNKETTEFDFETLRREICAAPSASFAMAISKVWFWRYIAEVKAILNKNGASIG